MIITHRSGVRMATSETVKIGYMKKCTTYNLYIYRDVNKRYHYDWQLEW